MIFITKTKKLPRSESLRACSLFRRGLPWICYDRRGLVKVMLCGTFFFGLFVPPCLLLLPSSAALFPTGVKLLQRGRGLLVQPVREILVVDLQIEP